MPQANRMLRRRSERRFEYTDEPARLLSLRLLFEKKERLMRKVKMNISRAISIPRGGRVHLERSALSSHNRQQGL